MLIVFSGLPGTGKTTLAKGLAATLGAVYVRIDTIEQALRDSADFAGDVGRTGYLIAYELAASNLGLGGTVVVDCVNAVMESRRAWSAISSRSGAPLVNIQVICSDTTEHRRRVETRQVDIPGLTPPDWQSVMNHDYEPWDTDPFTVDTALNSPAQALAAIAEHISVFESNGI
ncbi:putative kinase [Pseudomonas graminis]|uniref:AAA family ATPase n=1 Tax=Pseudomonas graminis TaxID=158627 RepID=UPI00105D2165|nr:AAA family ATPase [Pseudomonas graminis]TDV50187.1 putative kinase [Pseudomonas graminis]